MSKVYDFKEQLAIGDKGEELFLRYHPDVTRLDGRRGDFIGLSGRKIELKVDSRGTSDSPNIFIERFSSIEKQSNGGPWQSRENGVYYFVYLFADSVIYWFKVEDLIPYLEATEKTYPKRVIKNKGWSAIGWLVPRASVEHLIIKKEILNERS